MYSLVVLQGTLNWYWYIALTLNGAVSILLHPDMHMPEMACRHISKAYHKTRGAGRGEGGERGSKA